MIDVPVMGSDGYDYSFGYCSSGDVPQFSLYKQQTGELIPLYSQEIKEWSSNDISIIEVLNDQDINIPSSFAISNIYPNPFNPSTTIDISIPENMTISLRVLDLHGRVVDVIMEQDIVAGSHLFKYDGSNLSSGVYFIELQSSEYVQYSKMILLK